MPYNEDEDPLEIQGSPQPSGEVIEQSHLSQQPDLAPVPEDTVNVDAFARGGTKLAKENPAVPTGRSAITPETQQALETQAFQPQTIETPKIMHRRYSDPRLEAQQQAADQRTANAQQKIEQSQEDKRAKAVAKGLKDQGVEMITDPVTGAQTPKTDKDGRTLYKPGTILPYQKTADGRHVRLIRDRHGNEMEQELRPQTDPNTGEMFVIGEDGVSRVSVGTDTDYLAKRGATAAGKELAFHKQALGAIASEEKAIKEQISALGTEAATISTDKNAGPAGAQRLAVIQAERKKLSARLQNLGQQRGPVTEQLRAATQNYLEQKRALMGYGVDELAKQSPGAAIEAQNGRAPVSFKLPASTQPPGVQEFMSTPTFKAMDTDQRVDALRGWVEAQVKWQKENVPGFDEKAFRGQFPDRGGFFGPLRELGMGIWGAITDQFPEDIARIARGGDISLNGNTWADQWIREQEADKRAKGTSLQVLAGSGLAESLAQGPASVVTSAATGLTGSMAGRAVGSALGPVGGEAGSMLGAGAVSAGAFYRMAKDGFVQQVRDMLVSNNAQITEAQWQQAREGIEKAAQEYGLWEAGPEALSQAFTAGLFRGAGKLVGAALGKDAVEGAAKSAVLQIAKRYGLEIGEELATETVTQVGQGRIEAEHGLRDKAPTWGEAFKEVAGPTIVGAVLQGGAHDIYHRIRNGREEAALAKEELKADEASNTEFAAKWNEAHKDAEGFEELTPADAPAAKAILEAGYTPEDADTLDRIGSQMDEVAIQAQEAEAAGDQPAMDAAKARAEELATELKEVAGRTKQRSGEIMAAVKEVRAIKEPKLRHAITGALKIQQGKPLKGVEQAALAAIRSKDGRPFGTKIKTPDGAKMVLTPNALADLRKQFPAVAKLFKTKPIGGEHSESVPKQNGVPAQGQKEGEKGQRDQNAQGQSGQHGASGASGAEVLTPGKISESQNGTRKKPSAEKPKAASGAQGSAAEPTEKPAAAALRAVAKKVAAGQDISKEETALIVNDAEGLYPEILAQEQEQTKKQAPGSATSNPPEAKPVERRGFSAIQKALMSKESAEKKAFEALGAKIVTDEKEDRGMGVAYYPDGSMKLRIDADAFEKLVEGKSDQYVTDLVTAGLREEKVHAANVAVLREEWKKDAKGLDFNAYFKDRMEQVWAAMDEEQRQRAVELYGDTDIENYAAAAEFIRQIEQVDSGMIPTEGVLRKLLDDILNFLKRTLANKDKWSQGLQDIYDAVKAKLDEADGRNETGIKAGEKATDSEKKAPKKGKKEEPVPYRIAKRKSDGAEFIIAYYGDKVRLYERDTEGNASKEGVQELDREQAIKDFTGIEPESEHDKKWRANMDAIGRAQLSSTQVTLSQEDGKPFTDFAATIPDSELYTEDNGEGGDKYGREDEPHVTAFWGLKTQDAEDVKKAMAELGMDKIGVRFGPISIFEGEKYDVVKVGVMSDDLRRIEKRLRQEPNAATFPDYKPHLTLAYVKKGEGAKYVGQKVPGAKELSFDSLTFSSADRQKTEISVSQNDTRKTEAPVTKPSDTDADLVIVGCGKEKKDTSKGRVPAGELYTGRLTKSKIAYAKETKKPWMILSAHLGLVDPKEKVATYERNIEDLDAEQLKEWKAEVRAAVFDFFGNSRAGTIGKKIQLHAGQTYARALADALTGFGIEIVVPTQGKGVGEQQAWYNEALGEKPGQVPVSEKKPAKSPKKGLMGTEPPPGGWKESDKVNPDPVKLLAELKAKRDAQGAVTDARLESQIKQLEQLLAAEKPKPAPEKKPAAPQISAEASKALDDALDGLFMPPDKSRLRVAARTKNGALVVGKRGELHRQLEAPKDATLGYIDDEFRFYPIAEAKKKFPDRLGMPPAEQQAIPADRIGKIIGAAQLLIASGIRTPQALASVLEEKYQGKARPFSEAIWDAFGIADKSLRGSHDWQAIYATIDEAQNEPNLNTDTSNNEDSNATNESGAGSDVPEVDQSGKRKGEGSAGDRERDSEADAGALGGVQSDNVGDTQTPGSGGALRADSGSEGVGAGEKQSGERDEPNGRPGGSGKGLVSDESGGSGESGGGASRGNYHLTDFSKVLGGGPKARFARNKRAIELLAELEATNREPTAEELDDLAGYIGWGSFGQELFQGNWNNKRPKEGWAKEDEWLRDHLGKEAWESAQRSIINAHYTDPMTTSAMWDTLRAMGFKGGRVLEPAEGPGSFWATMPRDLMERSMLTGIELDNLTHRIAAILHPEANHQNKPYQESKTGDDHYDVAISNFPFANITVADRRYGSLKPSLHDYFFLKSLDQVRPGGLVVAITSAFSMDRKGYGVRLALAQKADLVAAFRLPTGAFEGFAGTAVVTDIIILRKREEGEPSNGVKWTNTKEIETRTGKLEVNEYYIDHPENVLGEMILDSRTTHFSKGLGVERKPDFAEQLKKIAERVPKDAFTPRTTKDRITYITNNTGDRQNAVVYEEGKDGLYVVRGDQLASLDDLVKWKLSDKKKSAKREKSLRALVDMRRVLGKLIDAQREGDAGQETLRTQLRKQYESFVKENGVLSQSDALMYLAKVGDPFFASLASLERNVGSQRRPDYVPSKILTEPTMRAKPRPKNPTVADAYVLHRNDTTDIQPSKIAEMANTTEEKVIKQLTDADAIYQTPTGNWDPREIYLSGNVRRKLREAREAVEGGNKALQRNVDALEKVVPKDIPYFNIEAKLGNTWTDAKDYHAFIAHLLNVDPASEAAKEIQIHYGPQGWSIQNMERLNRRAEAVSGNFGVPDYSFHKLVRAALNNRTVVIKRKDSDGKEYVDENASKQANAKVEAIREEFATWVWKDPTRRVRLENEYNEVFNAVALPNYDGSFLSFEGMALTKGDGQFELRQHQQNAIWRGIVQGRGIYAHEVGTGKAQPLDAKILTPTGWKRMGDMSVGDAVIAADGTPALVVGVYPQGVKRIYRVEMSDGSATECCDEHLWLTSTYQSRNAAARNPAWSCAQPRVRPLSEIRETLIAKHLGAKNHRIPVMAAAELSFRPVLLDAYLLGVLIGDGCLTAKSITFSTADKEIIDRVTAALPEKCVIRHRSNYDYAICFTGKKTGWGASSHPVGCALSELGVRGKRAHEKRVPAQYLNNSASVRLAVLRGLMDTDGTVSKKGTEVTFCSTSEGLADDVIYLIRSLGGVGGKSLKRIKGNRDAFTVSVAMPPDINPFALTRKAKRVVPKTKYAPARYIVDVSEVGEKEAQCIAISHPSRLYVTDDFIVTHNTYTMGGIAVESRRFGKAQKPLIFAHNANSKSVAAEIQEMYPGAKVLYVDNLDPKNRAVTMAQIATDDWDAIVVPHSLVDRFTLKKETLEELAKEEIASLEAAAIEAAEEAGVNLDVKMMDDPEAMKKVRSATAKELVKQRERIKEKIAEAAQKAKEDAIFFEDLGVDMVMVDEAHEFKKPPIATKMQMKGLNTATSGKSINLFFVTEYITRQQNGAGVHLFTGTPITNTLNEIFNMMRFTMNDILKRDGVNMWDAWFNTFADSVTDAELTPTGEYEPVTRLAAFVNTAELRRMVGEYMDTVFADDMPEMKPRPTKSGKTTKSPDLTKEEELELLNGRNESPQGRPYKVIRSDVADMSAAQKSVRILLAERAKTFRDASKKERRKMMLEGAEEMPVRVETDAANVGLDQRLFDAKLPADPNGKIARMVKRAMEHYAEHPLATQAIFMERGFSDTKTRTEQMGRDPATGKMRKREVREPSFNVAKDIVRQLVEAGVPAEQIAIVDGSMSKDKRKQVADAMKRGEIRFAIGSYQTLGVGVNMQDNLRAMHHLDAPWRPGDLEQRNGRGHRQGNKWNTVFEYRYITEGIDGRRWQVLTIKQQFINAFLKANENTRVIEGDSVSMEEGESISDIAETFAKAAGDPRLIIQAKLKKDVQRLMDRERVHVQGLEQSRGKIHELEEDIAREKRALPEIIDDRDAYQAEAGAPFSIEIDGKTYTDRDKANEELEKLVDEWGEKETLIGKFRGFDLYGFKDFSRNPKVRMHRKRDHMATASTGSFVANLSYIKKDVEAREVRIEEEQKSLENLKESLNTPFGRAAELEKKKRMLDSVSKDLEQYPVPAPAWLREGVPNGVEVYLDGKKRTVMGQRWGTKDWFVVLEPEAEGEAPQAVSYTKVTDENNIPIFEERPFEAPIAKASNKFTTPNGIKVGMKVTSDDDEILARGLGGVQWEVTDITPASEADPNWRVEVKAKFRNGQEETRIFKHTELTPSDVKLPPPALGMPKGGTPVTMDGKPYVLKEGILNLPAHHGTPHKVDRFTTDKIGTGEGAQVYGWGLYFAENHAVAESYKEALSNEKRQLIEQLPKPDVEDYGTDAAANARAMLGNHGLEGAKAFLDSKIADSGLEIHKRSRALLDKVDPSKVKEGNTYTVHLDVKDEDLLDWDKPLDEQSEKVKAAVAELELKSKGDFGIFGEVELAPLSGVTIYKAIEAKMTSTLSGPNIPEWMQGTKVPSAEAASKWLHARGIYGIRYLDQGSRVDFRHVQFNNANRKYFITDANGATIRDGSGKIRWFDNERDAKKASEDNRTRNFVIWDESKIKITHENGKPVEGGVLGMARKGRSEAIETATRQYRNGEISREERDVIVNQEKPVATLASAPEIPSEERIRTALGAKAENFGKARSLPAGTKVGVRMDIPSWTNHKVGVVTIHQPARGSAAGKVIGYDGIARLDNVRFNTGDQGKAMEIAAGDIAKLPGFTVEGEFNPSRALPSDLMEWAQVGFNPERHSFFYDKKSGRPVTGGKEAVAIGSTVFVKDPTYGKKEDFLFMPEGETPESTPTKEDLKDALLSAVKAMPEKQRKVLQARVQGKSIEEAAKAAGMTPQAAEIAFRDAKARLNRIREQQANIPSLYREVEAEQAPDRTLGRPELANVARGEKSRRFIDTVDELRKRNQVPETREDKEVFDEAARRMKGHYQKEKQLLLDKAASGAVLTDVETVMARKIVAREALNAVRQKDAATMLDAARIVDAYRMTGTEAARAFRLRRDFEMSPEERAAEYLGEALLTPDKKRVKAMDKAEKAGDLEKREAILKEWIQTLDRLKAKLKRIGLDLDNMTEDEIRKLLRDKTKAVRALKAVATAKADAWDALHEFWVASLLSAPATNIANIAGNAANAFWDLTAQRLMEATVNLVANDPKAARFGEYPYMLRGILPGLSKAFKNGLMAWKTESTIFEEEVMGTLGTNTIDHRGPAIGAGGKLGRVIGDKNADRAGRFIRIPLRLLLAADEFSKTLIGNMQVWAQAYRIAKAEKLKGNALAARIQSLVDDVGGQAWGEAIAKAKELAFQEELGPVGKSVISARHNVTGVRYIIPFVTAIANIFKTGIRKSPLGSVALLYRVLRSGLVRMNWGGQEWSYTRTEFVKHAAEQILAFGIIGALLSLLVPDDDGLPHITGSVPYEGTQRGQRDLAYRTAPPQSVKIGDRWYSYARIEPFATSLTATVDLLNRLAKYESGQDATKTLGDVWTHIQSQLKDKTFARGIGDLINATQDGESATEWAANFATSWVPNVVRASARETDDIIREQKIWGHGDEWAQRLKDRMAYKAFPSADNAPKPKVDIWGNDIAKDSGGNPATDWVWRMMTPSRSQKTEINPLDRLLVNYNNSHPNAAFAPTAPAPYWSYQKKTVYMSDQAYYDFLRLAGKMAVTQLAGEDLNYDQPGASDIKKIVETLSKARKEARRIIWDRTFGAGAAG